MATKAQLLADYDTARKALQAIYDTVRAVQPGDRAAAFKALGSIETLCEQALGPIGPGSVIDDLTGLPFDFGG